MRLRLFILSILFIIGSMRRHRKKRAGDEEKEKLESAKHFMESHMINLFDLTK